MKQGGFVEAVTKAIEAGTDCWEANYYMGQQTDNGSYEWDPRKLPVYMHTRESAIGPEWGEWRRSVMRMRGELPLIEDLQGDNNAEAQSG